MTAASLRAVDYRRVFRVLERCEDVRTVPEFRARIVTTITDTFPVRAATCFIGSAYENQFNDPEATLADAEATGAGAAAWERERLYYQQYWARYDVFGTPAARRRLEAGRVTSLRDLHDLPDESTRYVHGYLDVRGMRSVNAMYIDLPSNGHAVVGLFDADENALGRNDLAALQLLSRQLSVLTRSLVQASIPDPLATLTKRQRQVAQLVAEGLSNAAIARRLTLTEDTIKKYVSRILAATGCLSRTQLAVDVQRQALSRPT